MLCEEGLMTRSIVTHNMDNNGDENIDAQLLLRKELNNVLRVKAKEIRRRNNNDHQHSNTSLLNISSNLSLEDRTQYNNNNTRDQQPQQQHNQPQQQQPQQNRNTLKKTKQVSSPSPRQKPKNISKIPIASATTTVKPRIPQNNNINNTTFTKIGLIYDWDQHGRLHELKIRCLMRKYSNRWLRKVYGRVLPSTARIFYLRKIVRCYFNEWKDMWWLQRRGWKLQIRAEFHYRYQICNMIFDAWKQYTLQCHIKAAKIDVAIGLFEKKVLVKYLNNWKKFITIRREEKQLVTMLTERYNSGLIKSFFCRWMREFSQRVEEYCKSETALQHWSHQLLTKVWIIWRVAHHGKQVHKLKLCHAVRVHEIVILKHCMGGWKRYITHRQERGVHKALTVDIYKCRLLNNTFTLWKQRYVVSKSLSDKRERIQQLNVRIRLMRYINHWKNYMKFRHEKYERMEVADHMFRKILLRRCVTALHNSVRNRKWKIRNLAIANVFHKKTVLMSVWIHWVYRQDQQLEIQLRDKTQSATQHYRRNVTGKMFESWRKFTSLVKQNEHRTRTADQFWAAGALPCFFTRWQDYVATRKLKLLYRERARVFRERNLVDQHFLIWFRENDTSQDNRMMERMAILHYNEICVKHWFNTWRYRTDIRLHTALSENRAEEYYTYSLVSSTFTTWQDYTMGCRKRDVLNRRASYSYRNRLLIQTFTAWKSYMKHRIIKDDKLKTAVGHSDKKLLKLTLRGWCVYMTDVRNIGKIVTEKLTKHNINRMRYTFKNWRVNVREQINERVQMNRAISHRDDRLVNVVFYSWRQTALLIAYKHEQQRGVLTQSLHTINNNKISRYFYRWRTAGFNKTKEGRQLITADLHYSSKFARKLIQAWKRHHVMCLYKQLQCHQADLFHQQSLIKHTLSVWKSTFTLKLQENIHSSMALWHWSYVLQKRVLIAWQCYSIEKKRKKLRYSAAMEARTNMLLTDGLTRWLTVSSDMTSMRAKFIISKQTEDSYRLHRLVHKCATHWRHWARRRRCHIHPLDGVIVRHQPMTAMIFDSALHIDRPSISTIDTQLPPLLQTYSPVRHTLTKTQHRKQPRRPDFLLESLQREGLGSMSEPADKPTISISQAIKSSITTPSPLAVGSTTPSPLAVGSTELPPPPQAQLMSQGPPESSIKLLPPSCFTTPATDPPNPTTLPQTASSNKHTHNYLLQQELKTIKQKLNDFQRHRASLRDMKDRQLQLAPLEVYQDNNEITQALSEIDGEICECQSRLDVFRPEAERLANRAKFIVQELIQAPTYPSD